MDPCKYLIKVDICNKNGYCPKGDDCEMAHNKVEELYHFENYKQKFCSTYPNRLMECEYGEFCSFAHSESEIKTELLHNYVFDSDFYIFHYRN